MKHRWSSGWRIECQRKEGKMNLNAGREADMQGLQEGTSASSRMVGAMDGFEQGCSDKIRDNR